MTVDVWDTNVITNISTWDNGFENRTVLVQWLMDILIVKIAN